MMKPFVGMQDLDTKDARRVAFHTRLMMALDRIAKSPPKATAKQVSFLICRCDLDRDVARSLTAPQASEVIGRHLEEQQQLQLAWTSEDPAKVLETWCEVYGDTL